MRPLEEATEAERAAKERLRAATDDQQVADAESALLKAQQERYTLETGCAGCGRWRAEYERECRFSAGYAAELEAARQHIPRVLRQAGELLALGPAVGW